MLYTQCAVLCSICACTVHIENIAWDNANSKARYGMVNYVHIGEYGEDAGGKRGELQPHKTIQNTQMQAADI